MKEKITNKLFTENEYFKACCVNASVEPTIRQASKFQNQKGSAYKARKSVKVNDENKGS